jgi:hypothetical protein
MTALFAVAVYWHQKAPSGSAALIVRHRRLALLVRKRSERMPSRAASLLPPRSGC